MIAPLARLTIRQKLTAISVLSSAFALVPASLAFLVFDLLSFRQSIARRITTDAQIVGLNSVSPLLFDDRETAEATLGSFRADPAVVSAVIVLNRSDGGARRVFARYARDGAAPAALPAATRLQAGFLVEGNRLLVAEPIRFEDRTLGTLLIEAELGELRARMRRYAAIVVVVLGMSFALAFGISRGVERSLSRPILDLAETARAVSTKRDYSVRARVQGKDEVSQLVGTFNAMLDEIQRQNSALQESRAELERRVEARTRELAAANRELEAFSYSVSHDLRAPLRAIDGFSKNLLAKYSDGLDERGRHFLERVRAGSQRMAELIDDLLGLARIGRQPLARRPVDLSQIAGRVAAELLARSPARRVAVEIEEGLSAEADPRLATVVLENLMGNAWKFTARSEPAQVRVGRRDGPEPVFYVRDNGAGFDMAYADKLFGAFQRLHSEAEFEGTGIGLATVQRVVARHGGRVWAEGEPGRGATFYFTLEPSS